MQRSAHKVESSREDAQLAEQVKTVFQANRQVYGGPRVHAELHAQGIRSVSGVSFRREVPTRMSQDKPHLRATKRAGRAEVSLRFVRRGRIL